MKKLFGVLAFILIWQICAAFAANKMFPPPSDVLCGFLSNPKQLIMHSAYSVYRIAAGAVLAVAAGLPIGMLLGYFKKADKIFAPVLYMLAPMPKIAFLPLIMLFLGIGDMSKIFIVFIVTVFQVIVGVRDGVSQIPETYFMNCRAAKAGNRFLFLHIILPGALPCLFTAVRVGLATGISVLFFAESFGTRWGLGFYITDMWMRLDYRRMYAGIIALGIIGLLSAVSADRLEKVVCPWNA